jgi:hypothetical protein
MNSLYRYATDALILLGAGLAVGGVYRIHPPSGLIVGGVFLILLALVGRKRRGRSGGVRGAFHR